VGGFLPLDERRHAREGNEVRGEERGECGKVGGEGVCRTGFERVSESESRAGEGETEMGTVRTEGILALLLVRRRFEAEDLLVLVVQGDTGAVVRLHICMYLALHFCASCFAAAHDEVCATSSGEAELRGTGGGRMRQRCGICAIESVYLTRSFVVVRCGTSDQPSEHERGLVVGTRAYVGCRSDDYRVKVAHLLICE
jgi:hypothetical protein